MRGGHSDLDQPVEGEKKSDGLDIKYATDWSYGIDESLTFMIPGFMGTASGYDVGTDTGKEWCFKSRCKSILPVGSHLLG